MIFLLALRWHIVICRRNRRLSHVNSECLENKLWLNVEVQAQSDCPQVDDQTPIRKRRSRISITNDFSVKRQRVSIGCIDVEADPLPRQEYGDSNVEPKSDRFIASRSEPLFPMDTTPRTNRLAKVFGLADDRVLNFSDPPSSNTPDGKMLSALRRSASQLFHTPQTVHPTSASAHLAKRRQFILALDGPGIPQDPWAYPLAWSRKNVIAVACGHDIYYQNLDTRQVAHLCNLPRPSMGRIRALAFAQDDKPHLVSLGTSTGYVQVWDSEEKKRLRTWPNNDWMGVTSLSWKGREFATGRCDGKIAMLDIRMPEEVRKFKAHRGDIFGLQWSADGKYLVSSDHDGIVHVWDSRNMSSRIGKMKHEGAVKAVAWCPWKPDLLATAGTYPDGNIQIWSTSSLSSTVTPDPLHTIPTDTNVYSLHWSPHSKELMSTHGLAWDRPESSRDRLPATLEPVPSPLTNSITVHAYPSCRRLVSVPAHTGTVSQSCLSPDGTMAFTICYREEAMKMWKVWGCREEKEKRESAFDKFSIR
ncbi:WD40 repeat-like protein [Artomyces pyxidatus]|uniref:WD40 repeat-like protein n=1 Tax=Artomyces pyxidatus TaxID=48021 RepID=A0ACB8SM35_9AGAM|nr:WD40 repeat-like protein [Artomyces pyxidatus]